LRHTSERHNRSASKGMKITGALLMFAAVVFAVLVAYDMATDPNSPYHWVVFPLLACAAGGVYFLGWVIPKTIERDIERHPDG
jgi:hypothetical protein